MLSSDITLEEGQRVIDKANINKAVGVDDLPYEVVKIPNMLNILCYFKSAFSMILQRLCVNKSIIKPIPKSVKADPRVPLNYRGISLISTVCKLYTSIFNNRLYNYQVS